VLTAIGPVSIERWHGRCAPCNQVGFVADELLGLDGGVTMRARRMACLAGVHDPFRKAEQLLKELSGWSLDAETLRRYCHAEAAQASATRPERQALPNAFAQATGDQEMHTDAGKVNTPEGWRDVKIAVFACRERAASASSDDMRQRDLPAPSVRSVIAAVEDAESFGGRCQIEAQRLRLTDVTKLSVLGDGAEWIWNLADARFNGAAQVLDVYHALEHLAVVGRAAVGDGEPLTRWLETARRKLVGDGYAGVCEIVGQPQADAEVQRRVGEVVGPVLNYFAGHKERLGYAARLYRGQAIGSGLVEGTVKELVNLRMKRTGARWQAGRVGRFVELLAMSRSPEWDEYWTTLAA
jgi:hypothetical protein